MQEILIAAALLVAGIGYAVYKSPKAYRDVHPVLVMLIWLVAAFFMGAHVGATRVEGQLMPMIAEEEWDLAAQLTDGTVPLLEVLAVCCLALIFFLALRLLDQLVEANEE